MPIENILNLNLINTYKKISGRLYRNSHPTPVSQPTVVLFNQQLASSLGLNLYPDMDKLAQLLSGNDLLQESAPIAQAYAGHQFGHFNILGDGRAILLGEHDYDNLIDIQLKGSGPTPYSRRGDGRGTLSAMLREYLISEAMYALNIPTTRSLAVVKTGENVQRETQTLGAILTRTSKGHIRVGTFQYAATTDEKTFEKLVDYTVDRLYPHLKKSDNVYLALLNQVINLQAALVAKWQLVGFIHGVLNTDNVSIAGETIDYGPCAFMDTYHEKTVFSSIDQQGRYAYINQPVITQWNLARFAETLLPYLESDQTKAIEIAEKALNNFMTKYEASWQLGMSNKLGFTYPIDDTDFLKKLGVLMTKHQLDYTNTFVNLMNPLYESPFDDFKEWIQQWRDLLKKYEISPEAAYKTMHLHNPKVIPRNHLVEEALSEAVSGNLEPFNALLKVLQSPFEVSDKTFTLPPEPSNIPYKTYCGT